MSLIRLWEVGGAVRDSVLGIDSKDVDFTVEAPTYEAMREYLVYSGFHIYVEHPEFLTIRARPPTDSELSRRTMGADFVLCRKDSPGSDGRRPDYVEIGTIYDDLARRDFTMNAMAKNVETGEILDPHNGKEDLETLQIRFVGDPMKRIEEDGLRVIRALRFMVTKGMTLADETWDAVRSDLAVEMLTLVSVDRIRDELYKMFRADTLMTMSIIMCDLPWQLQDALFPGELWLEPTMKVRKNHESKH